MMGYWGGPFGYGYGMGGAAMIGVIVGWLVILFALVAGVIVVWRLVSGGRGDAAERHRPRALEILDERLARGELSEEEHARLSARLGRSGGREP